MSTSNPLRLNDALVRQAKAIARINKRSLPRQIEYWAELGRAVESLLTQEQLIAVREGLARIVVNPTDSQPVPSEALFSDIEEFRAAGTLAKRVTSASVRYQRSESHPGRLERIDADGTRTVGVFEGGRFVPVEP